MDYYFDMLNASNKNIPLDITVSDMLVLKAWDLNRVTDSGNVPPKLKVTEGHIEEEIMEMWGHTVVTSTNRMLRYWFLQNSPIQSMMGAFNAGGVHWQLVTFRFGKPEIVVVLDSLGGKCDGSDYLRLGHYFSMLQNMHYFQKPTAGKVKINNMNDSLYNVDADVVVLRMKSRQYRDLKVPTQRDSHNCGVYVLHYATCKACHAPYDVNLNAEKFKRRLLFFMLGLCWYLSSESDKLNDKVSQRNYFLEK